MTLFNIIADENIPYVTEAFSSLGKVNTLAGREMSAKDVKNADILLVRSVTQVNELLLKGSSVKFVASATIGYDHIDLGYLADNNIGFARAPASNAISAAEYVLTAIAFWSKKRNRDWSSLSIGIIGCGNVGARVKARCEAVGITCVINDPPIEEALVATQNYPLNWRPESDVFSSLNDALACDIVTLHVPLTKFGPHKTQGLINANNIQHIKKEALVLNIARGSTIDESVLHQRDDLDLILDCWQNEPNIDLDLMDKTLISTAHIAGYSLDGKIRGTEMIYQACCEFFDLAINWSSKTIAYNKLPILNAIDDSRDVLLAAYPIVEDTERLRKIKSADLSPALYFDYLRKNYPVRREFSFWTVDAQNLESQQKKLLMDLQFNIKP